MVIFYEFYWLRTRRLFQSVDFLVNLKLNCRFFGELLVDSLLVDGLFVSFLLFLNRGLAWYFVVPTCGLFVFVFFDIIHN